MNYDLMPTSELEEIYNRLGKEIEKRGDAKLREDWKKLVDQIQLFIKCHGLIDIQDEEGKLFYVDSDTDFSEFGVIYISSY